MAEQLSLEESILLLSQEVDDEDLYESEGESEEDDPDYLVEEDLEDLEEDGELQYFDSLLFQDPRLAGTVEEEEDLPDPPDPFLLVPPVTASTAGLPPPAATAPPPPLAGPPPAKRRRGRPKKQQQPGPPPAERRRGRPKKQQQPAVPQPPPPGPQPPPPGPQPPPPRPRTPPPRVDPTDLKAFKTACQSRKQQVSTETDPAAKWALLVEDEKQRSIHCGDWLWTDCTDEEMEINSQVEFTPPTPKERFSMPAKQARSELDFFRLFFKMEDLDLIVKETNRYAGQIGREFQATRSSLLGYLGLTIGMPLVRKDILEEYWSRDPLVCTLFFPQVMSCKAFQAHQRCMHLVDNQSVHMGDDGKPSDKLHKIRPLLNSFARSFHLHYTPGRELSIDEMMIGTKCPLHFLQHMKDKPTKWGIKVWTLCDAKVRYCLKLEIYTGGDGEKGLSFNVVNRLMTQYLGKGHRLYTDNFYTSPELLRHLLAHKTLAVGTVRNNRIHMPVRLRPSLTDVDVGQCIFLQSHGMTACRWKDKRDVFMISTVHGKSLMPVTRRQKRGGQFQEVVQKPFMVCDYNAHMCGVDVFDQLLSYHLVARRYKRWWLKVFWRLIDAAILNAFALWQLHHYPNCDPHLFGPKQRLPRHLHYRFRRALVHQLVSAQVEESAGVSRSLAPPVVRKHPLRHVGHPGTAPSKRRCVVCKSPSQTFQTCLNCDDKIRVHHSLCFFLLHSEAEPRFAYLQY